MYHNLFSTNVGSWGISQRATFETTTSLRKQKLNKMKKVFLTSIVILTCLNIGTSQGTDCFIKYEINDFLLHKVESITSDSLKSHIKYPPILRENEVEGYSKFMIMSYGDSDFEIIQMSSNFQSDKVEIEKYHSNIKGTIFKIVKNAFDKAGIEKLINNEKCFTEFTVFFDLRPFEEVNAKCDFLIKANKVELIIKRSH